jgi:hypothetical protein
MRDAPAKTRHAVQMAIAARSLSASAADAHRRRVIARYVFVYLDDVIRFAAPWRNRLRADPRSRAAADSALPALKRLRQDWKDYQHVRDYLAAKRQPRNPSSRVADELESFELWADIGELAVGTLVDDAIEVYAQLAAVTALPPVDYEPVCPPPLAAALRELDALGEEGSIEIAASSFGADRPGAFPIRMGGDIGRLVPLMNDVAENIMTLHALMGPASGQPIFEQLVRCQLPSELHELLILAVGPEPGGPTSTQPSLLELYSKPDSPPGPKLQLEELRDWISASIDRPQLRDWRNRVGAHIDAESPWKEELETGMANLDLAPISRVIDHVLDWLEACALEPHGPFALLFPARKLKSLFQTGSQRGLSYDDPDAVSELANIPSALPPARFADAPYMVWVAGGSNLSAAVAGMHAARARELEEKMALHRASAT